jgi:hypothetical protein
MKWPSLDFTGEAWLVENFFFLSLHDTARQSYWLFRFLFSFCFTLVGGKVMGSSEKGFRFEDTSQPVTFGLCHGSSSKHLLGTLEKIKSLLLRDQEKFTFSLHNEREISVPYSPFWSREKGKRRCPPRHMREI